MTGETKNNSKGGNLFVELHVLVSHPPSNLNRDELGSPKTAVFGGQRRLRISSQCLKRSWRLHDAFKSELEDALLGKRSQLLPGEILERLDKTTVQLDDKQKAGFERLFRVLGANDEKKDESDDKKRDADGNIKTRHLLYLSNEEVDALVSFVTDHLEKLTALDAASDENEPAPKKGKSKQKGQAANGDAEADRPDPMKDLRKDLTKHLARTKPRSAVDVSLFGRFLTSDEFRTIDAAMQVAHALGTERADLEYDYFTAVDDLSGEAAAGHIGESELASAVFYKYAACDIGLLLRNLEPSEAEVKASGMPQEKQNDARTQAREVAGKALAGIVRAAALAVPTGKKNSTAPQNPADYLEVVIRRDQPVSLVNAFLEPVRDTRDTNVMSASVVRLREWADTYDVCYGAGQIVARLVLDPHGFAPENAASTARIEQFNSLAELAKKLRQHLGKELSP